MSLSFQNPNYHYTQLINWYFAQDTTADKYVALTTFINGGVALFLFIIWQTKS